MTKIIMIHDLVEANGKTIKENNLAKVHQIPNGSLVELDTGARVFVCGHARDCDGTPLYLLSPLKDSIREDPYSWPTQHEFYMGKYMGGYSERSLKVTGRI
jgi:hypothetical protein